MRRLIRALIAAAAASAVGFALHKAFADRLPAWISAHMEGVQIKLPPYGPEVVVPAALSSLESGIAFVFAYVLVRKATPSLSVFLRAVLVAALCLGLQGALVRMPLMQLVIGNPLLVTLGQHAAIWLPYVAESLVVAYAYELLCRVWSNPSIERTSSSELRSPTAAAHVKR